MSTTPLHLRRSWQALLAATCIAPFAVASAQSQSAPQPAAPAAAVAEPQADADKRAGRQNQKIEHIHVEDSGASVDELRVGGQTQNITVTPKSNAPAYQVMPNEEERKRQGKSESGPGDNGPRVWWNVFKF